MKAEMNFDNIGGGATVYEEYVDTSTLASGANYTVQCGFQPSKIWIVGLYTASSEYVTVNFDSSLNPSQQLYTQGKSNSGSSQYVNLGYGNAGRINSIDTTNFVVGLIGQNFTFYHILAMP